MKLRKVKIIVLVGIIAFVGIVVIQIYWLRQAFEYEQKKFSQNIQVSLLEVVNEINRYYGYKTPLINPVQKLSEDYYVVNIHNDFDAGILEFYLTKTFTRKGLDIDYEYAIYDCETDAMVYGSYVNVHKTNDPKAAEFFPKANNLVYYFALRFPQENIYILASLKHWVIVSLIMIIVLLIYLYSIYVILQQKKYADLQRDFINNMTHEFKTPLSSILIASKYLAQQSPIASNEKLGKYAHIIIDQSNKLDSQIEKILDIAKADNTPLTLKKSAVNASELIRSAVDNIRLKYPEAIINTDLVNKEQVIMADPFHFANIVYNFLDNSIKYCEQRAQIDITTIEEKNMLVIKFIDNGIGIPKKNIKQVFEKFYRVPNSKKQEVNGFGLGLFYVQNICRLHQWKLSIESSINSGTIVNLMIKRS